MDTSAQYGQQDFNLPHDVVELPSKGKFYENADSANINVRRTVVGPPLIADFHQS